MPPIAAKKRMLQCCGARIGRTRRVGALDSRSSLASEEVPGNFLRTYHPTHLGRYVTKEEKRGRSAPGIVLATHSRSHNPSAAQNLAAEGAT